MKPEFNKEQFLRQIARASEYIKARQGRFLEQNLADITSLNAIRNWIKDVESESKGYNKAEFSNAMAAVPDYSLFERVRLYHDILHNSGLKPESQNSIKVYEGNYRLVLPNGFSSHEKAIRFIKLKAYTRPYFFGFAFKYNPDPAKKSVNSICDGMLFRRGGRFYMLGTAPETTLMAHFKAESYPDRHAMLGAMTLEVIPNKTFLDTRFAIVKYEADNHDDMINQARAELR